MLLERSNRGFLKWLLFTCVTVCLCSSKTLPDSPVFVFAPRTPLHFLFTGGKPCVKIQLTLIPATTQRANPVFHWQCTRLHFMSNRSAVMKAFNEDVTRIVSRNSQPCNCDFVFICAECPEVNYRSVLL